jgi:hypothetical protein
MNRWLVFLFCQLQVPYFKGLPYKEANGCFTWKSTVFTNSSLGVHRFSLIFLGCPPFPTVLT